MEIDCPSCKKDFDIYDEEPEINRQLVCPHCQQHFEVTWLYPLTIDFIEDFSAKPEYSVGS